MLLYNVVSFCHTAEWISYVNAYTAFLLNLLPPQPHTTTLPSCCCCPVAQSHLTLSLCTSMDCSVLGFPVHHQLPELAPTYARWVGDALQLSCPLLAPSPPAFSLSQHQVKHPILLSHHRTLSWALMLYSSFPFFNSESLQYSYMCLHLNKPGTLNCCPVKGIKLSWGRIWRFLSFGTNAWLPSKGFICICFRIIKI